MEGAGDFYSRMRNAANVLRLGSVDRSVRAWCIAGRGEVVHGGCGGVCWGLLETSARNIMLQAHDLCAVTSRGVGTARYERRC